MTIDRLTGRKIKVSSKPEVALKPKTKKKKKLKKKPKTYVVMILDRSGSMWSSRESARAHFNNQVNEIIKSAVDQDVRVSLCMFNRELFYRYFNKDLDRLCELGHREYTPGGSTSLNDAIGLTIRKLQNEVSDLDQDHVSVLFYIISDGYENSSMEYGGTSGRLRLKGEMQKLQSTGRWTFTYMGTEHDVGAVARSLSIPTSNTLAFDRKEFGKATMDTNKATNDYFKSRSVGQKSSDQFYDKKI